MDCKNLETLVIETNTGLNAVEAFAAYSAVREFREYLERMQISRQMSKLLVQNTGVRSISEISPVMTYRDS